MWCKQYLCHAAWLARFPFSFTALHVLERFNRCFCAGLMCWFNNALYFFNCTESKAASSPVANVILVSRVSHVRDGDLRRVCCWCAVVVVVEEVVVGEPRCLGCTPLRPCSCFLFSINATAALLSMVGIRNGCTFN